MGPFEAARAAVHLHGRAGDLAAEELGQIPLVAGDLIQYLPRAILSHPLEKRVWTDPEPNLREKSLPAADAGH
jgi:hypothetical protein